MHQAALHTMVSQLSGCKVNRSYLPRALSSFLSQQAPSQAGYLIPERHARQKYNITAEAVTNQHTTASKSTTKAAYNAISADNVDGLCGACVTDAALAARLT